MIEFFVHAHETHVIGVAYLSRLEKEIQSQTFYMSPGHERDPRFIMGAWDGRVQLFLASDPHRADARGASHIMPTGLLPKVLDMLAARGEKYTIINKIPKWEKDPALAYLAAGKFSVRDYQTSSVLALIRPRPLHHKMMEAWRAAYADEAPPQHFLDAVTPPRLGGVLEGATGMGKTRVAARLIQNRQVRTVFLVNQKDLMKQTIDSFTELLGCKIGQVGGGVCDIQDVTVATIQTVCRAANYEVADDKDVIPNATQKAAIVKMMRDARLVILDECHSAPAPTAYNSLRLATKAGCVVGLSASPWRDDGMDLLIEAACGPIAFKVSASDLIDRGFLVQPDILIHQLPAPVGNNPDRYTDRYDKVYKAWVVNDAQRNAYIADQVMNYIIDSQIVLVLVKQIEHGKLLQQLIPHSVFLEGKLTKTKRLEIIEATRNGDILCLIATSLADQGLDIPAASVVVLAGGGKSSTKALQRIGRVLRPAPGKTKAWVIDLVDQHPSLKRHYHERLRIYKTERRFNVIQVKASYANLKVPA